MESFRRAVRTGMKRSAEGKSSDPMGYFKDIITGNETRRRSLRSSPPRKVSRNFATKEVKEVAREKDKMGPWKLAKDDRSNRKIVAKLISLVPYGHFGRYKP